MRGHQVLLCSSYSVSIYKLFNKISAWGWEFKSA